jgi:hypothetical protein
MFTMSAPLSCETTTVPSDVETRSELDSLKALGRKRAFLAKLEVAVIV